MKIFLASASLDDSRWGTSADLVDGIFTSPSLLASATAGENGQGVLGEICLASEGIRVGATLIFNSAQAVLAAKLGVSMLTVALDRLEEVGQRSSDIIT